ncbi:twin-arginine translocation signal domain-containing protein [Natrinema salinisoli]|uniref:twin-arginine translocation signal domain-containing protein n=1 Tax=Natrinema salinisoli TaxID=2878535 RepID=UPI001CF0C104|nr:twin-arginine translocation signal domain-containing protein [Natrinema salinisoli]
MNRRHFLTGTATTALAGCAGAFGTAKSSRLDLTVQNDRADQITVRITVTDEEGTMYEDASDRIDSGVARAFEVVAGTEGRHEVTVSGEDWRGQLAWHADTCALFDGTIRVAPESVEVASECLEQR